jgi:outer membrane protein OmpA-like peptidoglycan-associated protein
MRRARQALGALIFLIAAGVVLSDAAVRVWATSETVTIGFARGVSPAPGVDAAVADIANRLTLDPDLRVVLNGHTGTLGDGGANRDLGARRAEAIKALLIGEGIAEDRIATRGLGGDAPLARQDGESDRAYQNRLGRVEAVLTGAPALGFGGD